MERRFARHWDGNTLVVDVANLNGKALLGRSGEFTSDQVHVVERYVFSADNQRYNYIATFADPEVFTRPWTATIPARRRTANDKANGWRFEASLNTTTGQPVLERHERICVENNGGFGRGAVAAVAR